ncbi:MAG TPA: hypothetical protein DCS93_16895 [Microscillaceae bacterium]|nr:hypothetical protein [Microscillaceae bacterium]
MKSLLIKEKRGFLFRLLLVLLALALAILPSCHQQIRLTQKNGTEIPAGSEGKLFFQKFVAGKLTERLSEVLPDTLASIQVADLFPGEDLQNLVLDGRYSVGGIYFTSKDENKSDSIAQITVHLRYNLKELLAFVKNRLLRAKPGKINRELLEAIDLSLEILTAYYDSVAKVPLVGEVQTTLPNAHAATRQVFLTKLQIISFKLIEQQQPKGSHKQLLLQLRWNADKFEEFLVEVLAGKYKVEVVNKKVGDGNR